MSLAAISASYFHANPAPSALPGARRPQEPFTLPDQSPVPGHAHAKDDQAAAAGLSTLHGGPLFNVRAGAGQHGLQGQPEFNVLLERAGAADPAI